MSAILTVGLLTPGLALASRHSSGDYSGYALLICMAAFFVMILSYNKGKDSGRAEAWSSARHSIENAKTEAATELIREKKALAAEKEGQSKALADEKKKLNAEMEAQRKALFEEKNRLHAEIDAKHKSLFAELGEQKDKIKAEADEQKERQAIFEKLVTEKENGFPWLAGKLAEFYTAKDEATAVCLETKKNPAIKKGQEVRQIKAEKRALIKELKIHQYQLEYYESLFPWLLEYRDIPEEEIIRRESETEETTPAEDPAFQFFAAHERVNLTRTELFQRALDRYVARRKSNWEIGRDYERYIGSKMEMDGFDVEYFGARRGKEDLGRDLIAKKNDRVKIIQCKYWAGGKTIHEKHIFQLFGSALMYACNEGGALNATWALAALRNGNVTPVLVCSCAVSELARSMADGLGVTVRDNHPFDPDYPRIKCNISRKDKEKIFHLPFDQMYDRIKIEPDEGEFYANTVAEAEAAGYRRAFRWRGDGMGGHA